MGALVLGLFGLAGALATEPPVLDVGASGGASRALVVPTPGLDPLSYDRLIHELERRDIDAWMLALPPDRWRLASVVQAEIPAALAALGADGQRVVLVGHGVGGAVAAMAVAGGHAKPAALAMLGAPLAWPGSELSGWLAELPSPAQDLDLTALADRTWRGHSVLGLLLGDPLPGLTPVPAAWLADLQEALRRGQTTDLRQATMPVWAGGASRDNLGPPDSIRRWLPPESFVRFGYLRLDAVEPDAIDLLTGSEAPAALAAWTRRALRRATDDAAPPNAAPSSP